MRSERTKRAPCAHRANPRLAQGTPRAEGFDDVTESNGKSERWKSLERTAARALGGKRIPRWLDFGQSAPDVVVEDFHLVIDAKAHKRFSHHSLMANIETKYCERGETPVLVTKAERQIGEYATIPLGFLAGLLDRIRANAAFEQCVEVANARVNANVNLLTVNGEGNAT